MRVMVMIRSWLVCSMVLLILKMWLGMKFGKVCGVVF